MILHGKNIVILNSTGTAVVAAAKSCEINISADTAEVSSTTSGAWHHYKKMRKAWNVLISHLLLSLAHNAAMVGESLIIKLSVKTDAGKAFAGFVDNPTVQSQSLVGAPARFWWDTTRNRFLGESAASTVLNRKYYINWGDDSGFLNPSAYDLFTYNGVAYTFLDNTLTAEQLTGTAIVQSWKATATKGNLATGTFVFQGSGPLEPIVQ